MISHGHEFILILIPKTGTNSIKNKLSKLKSIEFDLWVDSHYVEVKDENLDYLKIATSRNPYSRVVSMWAYWNSRFAEKGLPTVGFSYFVKRFSYMKNRISDVFSEKEKIHFYTCIDGISLSTNDQLSYTDIDLWIKFENLQEDFNTVCDKIGIPRQELPHKNKTEHKHYTEYYDEETKQIVAEKYAKDIEYFGYEFGE